MNVIKELSVAVGSYEDRSSGQTKNRYKPIGVLMESTDRDGRTNQFIMLDRSFNPAGVPFKQGSDKILISLFDPKPRDGSQGGQSRGHDDQPRGQSGSYGAGGRPGRNDMDDEAPFAAEWRA